MLAVLVRLVLNRKQTVNIPANGHVSDTHVFELKQHLPVELDAFLVDVLDGHDVPLEENKEQQQRPSVTRETMQTPHFILVALSVLIVLVSRLANLTQEELRLRC